MNRAEIKINHNSRTGEYTISAPECRDFHTFDYFEADMETSSLMKYFRNMGFKVACIKTVS
jgi:hypothetical protein